jgi:hypothetical protein
MSTLAQYRAGRILLHCLCCLRRPYRCAFFWGGIWRELSLRRPNLMNTCANTAEISPLLSLGHMGGRPRMTKCCRRSKNRGTQNTRWRAAGFAHISVLKRSSGNPGRADYRFGPINSVLAPGKRRFFRSGDHRGAHPRTASVSIGHS